MSNVIYHGDVAFGKGSLTAFSFGKPIGPKEEQHTIINEETTASGSVAKWGDDNMFPQNLLKKVRLNGSAGAGLRFLKATHYGQGFMLFKEEATEDGKRDKQIVSPSDHPEIRSFFQRSKMNRCWLETISDLETFQIAFPEFILSKDFNKVLSVRRLPTAKCRFKRMNEKTGLIEEVGFCHNWKSSTTFDSEFVEKIKLIDSYWSGEQIKEYCKKNKIYKFVMPIFYPLMDESYYPKAEWHAVYHNGWMDVANSIPLYKQKLFENQLHIKYVVHISEEYFQRTYGADWQDFTPDKKIEIRKTLLENIDKHLSGNENAGKSIQSVTYKDAQGEWVQGIKVEAIDDKLKDGAYLPEASAANGEIIFSLGMDPTLIGAGIPGGKLNTGSGSDKREAFSILTSLFKTKRETTLDIWRMLRDYNQWPEELEGDFANTVLTTLDKNPTGVQNGI